PSARQEPAPPLAGRAEAPAPKPEAAPPKPEPAAPKPEPPKPAVAEAPKPEAPRPAAAPTIDEVRSAMQAARGVRQAAVAADAPPEKIAAGDAALREAIGAIARKDAAAATEALKRATALWQEAAK
ncbi:MAG: hypothetical protein NW201_01915, partial [Gemmatimonadales bacterium]|nr:hypothetical protein [Gemmatimonadales bacterium]